MKQHEYEPKESIVQAEPDEHEVKFLGPDRLYTELVYRRSGPLSASIDERFVVLARPGELPLHPPGAGDVLVRVALGEPGLGHIAVLSGPVLLPWQALDGAGVSSEREGPGLYATVSEGGAFPHTPTDRFARRVLDRAGRMPLGQVLLRPKPPPAGLEPHNEVAGRLPTEFDDEHVHGDAVASVGETLAEEAEVPAAVVTFPSGASLRVVATSVPEGSKDWDPNRSGNPLLDTSVSQRSVRLSANFTVGELAQSGGRLFDRARIDPKLVACLQRLRERVGKPVNVTSGYRPYLLNVELYRRRGKKPTASQHSSGRAADLRVAGMTGMEIAKAAIDACSGDIGVGIGSNFAHVDVRGAFAKWTYPSGDARATSEIVAYQRARAGGSPATPSQQHSQPAPVQTVNCGEGEHYVQDAADFVPEIKTIMKARGWDVANRLQTVWVESPANQLVGAASDGMGTAGPLAVLDVSIDWALTFERARSLYEALVQPSKFANEPARLVLRKKIDAKYQRTGDQQLSFGDLSTKGRGLEAEYTNYEGLGKFAAYQAGIDALAAALGRFTMYVIPSGSAARQKETTVVKISKLGIYLRDSYDFNGEQDLGFWRKPDEVQIEQPSELEIVRDYPRCSDEWFEISNASFRTYRERTGRGADFVVYSDVKVVNLDKPVTFEY